LTADRHCRSPARIVIGVTDAPLGSALRVQPIQTVIGPRYHPRDRIIDLSETVGLVIGVRRAGAVLIGNNAAPVQGVVGVNGFLELSVPKPKQIATGVVDVTFNFI